MTIKEIAQTALDWFDVHGFGYDEELGSCFYLSNEKKCYIGCQLVDYNSVFEGIALSCLANMDENDDFINAKLELSRALLASGIDISDKDIFGFCQKMQNAHDRYAYNSQDGDEYRRWLLEKINE
jgi:hypothetical protein